MDSFPERLSAATLDDKARITAKDRFTNAQSPKVWSMSTSLAPANALPKHTCVVPLLLPSAGTRIKALWASLLAGPDKKWTSARG
ncbi:hypothetical protein A4X09_0g2765 [Tilletia walkeri]|uniref:Uncharacterized protein n=1 Tax=Tilletia walkeri TaxID=117179 RepID=A0A8X7T5I6_9BASI|nr:hypothetical protein A4X09_0g2765 [Tilletia walkeri]